MLQRLTHAAMSFAIVVAFYQAYVVLAVPFLVPSWSGAVLAGSASLEQRERAESALHKHRDVLTTYFSTDHWCLKTPPIVFEHNQSLIVLDGYHPRNNGEVKVDRLAILFFPKARIPGSSPPRDAIILEAIDGALLEMDKSIESGLITDAQLESVKLPGKIIVRSDMSEVGPQDDLYLVTRDLHITESMIRTEAKVDMQLGPHRGHGRELEIRLLPPDRSGSGLNMGGIESLEVTRDVTAVVLPKKGQWQGQFGISTPDPSNDAPKKSGGSELPIHVTSQGPFTFDFGSYIGSFVKQVRVIQIQSDGQRDKVDCEELNFFFASTRTQNSTGNSEATHGKITGIHPAMVEMIGMPVQVEAPSQQMKARCERMRIEIGPRRVTFYGQDEVMLHYQSSEIHAPWIQYQHPPEGSVSRLGTMSATGSGRLRVETNPQKKQEPFEVEWLESLRLDREAGQPVLVVQGRPKMKVEGLGHIWADRVKLYLREQVAGSLPLPGEIVPDRMLAEGHVAIESTELNVRVHHMAIWLEYPLPESGTEDPSWNHEKDAPSGSLQDSLVGKEGTGMRSYEIAGNHLRLKVAVRNRKPAITMVSVDGNVEFRERHTTGTLAEPLLIKAGLLKVEQADMPSAKILIQAKPTQAGEQPGFATVSVRGMTFRTAAMELNRGSSRVWVGTPGDLQILVDRDFQGNPLATAEPLTITWQQSMELIQDKITFLRNVTAVGQGGELKTEQLVARLSVPVRFDGARKQQSPELVQIECLGGVAGAFQQRDERGVVSQQWLQMQTLLANRKTGRLAGDGPGWFESVHLTNQNESWDLAMASQPERGSSQSGLYNRTTNPDPVVNRNPHLRFLRINFERELKGNLIQREVSAIGRVRAIYGPVDSWGQKLQMKLRGTPEPQTVWIHSDRLGISESPLARSTKRGKLLGQSTEPLELVAEGKVIIEGNVPQHGAFTARANRATYDQLKTMFVLEGDATLTQQQSVGGIQSSNSVQKFIYTRSNGWKAEGVSSLQWQQFMGQKPGKKVPR